MLKKFSIDYVMQENSDASVHTHETDDPVAVEEFLMQLLEAQADIRGIRHEGEPLTQAQFDRMIRIAAERIMAAMIGESLHLDPQLVRSRFDLAA